MVDLRKTRQGVLALKAPPETANLKQAKALPPGLHPNCKLLKGTTAFPPEVFLANKSHDKTTVVWRISEANRNNAFSTGASPLAV